MKFEKGKIFCVDMNAQIAFALIERWGMIAAMPDGEDSAGRQKFRLQTPEELVARAFTVATDAVGYATRRGFVIEAEGETGAP